MSGGAALLLRLVAAGLICSGLLSLSGGGPQREILRFGCACLTVIVLMSALEKVELPSGRLAAYEDRIQQRVETARQESREALLAQIVRELEQEVERQLTEVGLRGSCQVTCTAEEGGQLTVTGVRITCQEGAEAAWEELRQTLAARLGISAQAVILEETEEKE